MKDKQTIYEYDYLPLPTKMFFNANKYIVRWPLSTHSDILSFDCDGHRTAKCSFNIFKCAATYEAIRIETKKQHCDQYTKSALTKSVQSSKIIIINNFK